jgi:hypothetical protein
MGKPRTPPVQKSSVVDLPGGQRAEQSLTNPFAPAFPEYKNILSGSRLPFSIVLPKYFIFEICFI